MATDKRTLPGTRIRDLTGETFGRLTVVEFIRKDIIPCLRRNRHGHLAMAHRYRYYWSCQCVCGTKCLIETRELKSGKTISCGCYAKERSRLRLWIHGMAETRIHARWINMLQRCYLPSNNSYSRYGARGIDVCPEWRESFLQFYADVGEIPFSGATLDRIDNNRGYYPDNVRWATATQQAQNTRSNHLCTIGEETLSVAAWAKRAGFKPGTILARLKRGLSIEDALSLPLQRKKEL